MLNELKKRLNTRSLESRRTQAWSVLDSAIAQSAVPSLFLELRFPEERERTGLIGIGSLLALGIMAWEWYVLILSYHEKGERAVPYF